MNYEIQVKGVLDAHWAEWFEGLELRAEGGTTVISGLIPDQAALHGLLRRTRTRMHEELGREPTDDELAEALGVPVPQLLRLQDAGQTITSLDTPVGDDGAALQDLLEDTSAVGPDELAIEAVGRQVLDQVLAALPEGQRQVMILRFGLDSGTPRTLEEVGAVMGFSRERARMVERAALTALRRDKVRARLEDDPPAWRQPADRHRPGVAIVHQSRAALPTGGDR